MDKKKILHITTWYPNKFDKQLGIFVQKHIFKCHQFSDNVVIALIPHSKARKVDVKITEESNVKVIIGYYPTIQGKRFRNYRNYIACINQIFDLFLGLNFAPNLIHCHVAEKSLDIATKYFEDTPILLTEHWSGFIDGRFEKLSIRKQAKRITQINKCNHIFCVSPQIKEKLSKNNVTTSISLIDNVIEYQKVKSKKNENFSFLVVSDLVDSIKNISGILTAFSKHLITFPNHRLHIIGDGKDAEILNDLVDDLKINTSVTFFGRKDNPYVLSHLPNADSLIVNSYFETYSMITAEALLSGVPVISSRCGGPEQFIIEGENGYTFEKDNEEALINAMKKVTLSNLDFNKIHIRFSKKLDTASITKNIETIIDQLLKEK